MSGAACIKIILNGQNVASLTRNAADMFNYESVISSADAEAIIKLLNQMEDEAIQLQKMCLKALNYSGPVGKMLS